MQFVLYFSSLVDGSRVEVLRGVRGAEEAGKAIDESAVSTLRANTHAFVTGESSGKRLRPITNRPRMPSRDQMQALHRALTMCYGEGLERFALPALKTVNWKKVLGYSGVKCNALKEPPKKSSHPTEEELSVLSRLCVKARGTC
eukprot:4714410-Amphidinium_carterae.2